MLKSFGTQSLLNRLFQSLPVLMVQPTGIHVIDLHNMSVRFSVKLRLFLYL